LKKNVKIQLNPRMPAIDAGELHWIRLGKSPESL
jgi:hypothetical protein